MSAFAHGGAALDLSGALVPMGQMRVWQRGDGLIGTRALGSCVAVMVRERFGRIAGLAHCMLPLSRLDTATASIEPCTFTDSGIAALREGVIAAGARADALDAYLVGGASLLGALPTLNMGPRNVEVARILIDQFGMRLVAETTGGQLPRSLWFDPQEGWVDVFCAGKTTRLRDTL